MISNNDLTSNGEKFILECFYYDYLIFRGMLWMVFYKEKSFMRGRLIGSAIVRCF